jgi:hypothetical protein
MYDFVNRNLQILDVAFSNDIYVWEDMHVTIKQIEERNSELS